MDLSNTFVGGAWRRKLSNKACNEYVMYELCNVNVVRLTIIKTRVGGIPLHTRLIVFKREEDDGHWYIFHL